MSTDRVSMLIAKYLDDDLSEDERRELDLLVDSNSHAADSFDAARRFKENLDHNGSAGATSIHTAEADDENIRPPRTSLALRIGAGALVLLLLASIAYLPFIDVQAKLIEVRKGRVYAGQERITVLDEPAEIRSADDGAPAQLVVRGGTLLTVYGDSRLRVEEPWPHARIVMLSGALRAQRHHRDREFLLAAANWEFSAEEGTDVVLVMTALTAATGQSNNVQGAGLPDGLDIRAPIPDGAVLRGRVFAGTITARNSAADASLTLDGSATSSAIANGINLAGGVEFAVVGNTLHVLNSASVE